MKIIGIPKTIDNDVPFVDNTFGFTTALGVICEAVDRVRTTAFSHDRVQILEVMGRNCGWLALEGGLSGGADIILLPEIPYDIYKIVDLIKKRDEQGHFDTVIVVSEGAKPLGGDVVVSKVIENSQRDINIAFMNELSMVFDKMGIDTNEVVDGMNTKWNALGFKPGLVGGHCIGVDPYYLTNAAEKLGYHSQIILAGRKINDDMPNYVADVIIKELEEVSKKFGKERKTEIIYEVQEAAEEEEEEANEYYKQITSCELDDDLLNGVAGGYEPEAPVDDDAQSDGVFESPFNSVSTARPAKTGCR